MRDLGKRGQTWKIQTDTFLIDKLCADLDNNRGLNECEPEYLVIPQPEALVAKPAWNNVHLVKEKLIGRQK